jgi:MoaA/NifB/PqqE/SkfB family radical SAM enzyme
LRILQSDLAGASAVTSQGNGHQFEIQLGHLCNNRCVFCSSGQMTAMKLAKPIPLEPMIAAIEEARASGARRITFLGGEPTLHRGFVDALRRCVELRFEEIVIFTNGVLLPQPGFIAKVLALDFPFEWRISIQGANEDAHVAVTKKPDSFRRIVEGMKLLRARGQKITANMCVNEESYRSLPEYPALVAEHGIRQLHIDVIRPSSIGERTEEFLQEIMPRYSVMAPHLAEMLARFDAQDPTFDVNIGNLPFCVLPQWAHRIHHGGDLTITKSSDGNALEVAVDKYDWHSSLRQHTPRCDSCVFRPQCTGVFSTYLAMYGDDEFQPVSLDSLRQWNTEQHHFVLLVGPALERLKLAAGERPPSGWQLSNWVADGRKQQVDIQFASAAGKASLRLTHPSSRTDTTPVWTASAFQLELMIDPLVREEALRVFLSWLGPTLESELQAVPQKQLDDSLVVDTHRRHHTLAVGRTKVQQLAAQAEQAGPFGTWHVAGRREEGGDAIVELNGPNGSALEVVFTIREPSRAARVSVDARLVRAVTAETARSVVQDVVTRLKASPPA